MHQLCFEIQISRKCNSFRIKLLTMKMSFNINGNYSPSYNILPNKTITSTIFISNEDKIMSKSTNNWIIIFSIQILILACCDAERNKSRKRENYYLLAYYKILVFTNIIVNVHSKIFTNKWNEFFINNNNNNIIQNPFCTFSFLLSLFQYFFFFEIENFICLFLCVSFLFIPKWRRLSTNSVQKYLFYVTSPIVCFYSVEKNV